MTITLPAGQLSPIVQVIWLPAGVEQPARAAAAAAAEGMLSKKSSTCCTITVSSDMSQFRCHDEQNIHPIVQYPLL
jgi:hypothetical protein